MSAFATDSPPFLASLPPDHAQRRLVLAVFVVSLLFFVAALPFAKVQLAPVWAFIPVYETALVINDLLSAILIFGQFGILRSSALLALGAGYLFTASIAGAHALTFPGLFAPAGLLGAGPQSTAWLYMFWHAGFPLFVVAYALLKGRHPSDASRRFVLPVAATVGVVLALVAILTLLASAGQAWLPVIMAGQRYTPAMLVVVGTTWIASFLALAVLWRRRPHSVLDLWLMLVVCASLFDIALSAVFNHGRFDLGFYAGRIYGLFAASFVLITLLLENGKLYAELAGSYARERQKSAELAAANAELDSFSYAVSHDLRAPLRAMNGFSQALIEDYRASLESQAQGYLDEITKASRRMGELIDGILALSRCTRGELRRDDVDISLLATRLLDTLAQGQPERRVTWQIDSGLRVLGDARMIEVLLANLLDNAWKYTSRTAAPIIRVYAGELDGLSGICIADNGAGFSMEHAARLFQIFQRLHRQDEFPGIGIGLVTVQRIVHRHGGQIRAVGRPGAGATFCFACRTAQERRLRPARGDRPNGR